MMKTAVVGCGALGSYYGAKLARDGQNVHFLLRSDFELVRRQGVRIQSPEGDFHINPKCARTPGEIGPCDLVIVGLKTTANGEFARLVTPLVAHHTAVLTLQNGLGNEAQLAALFGTEKILGGLCFVCLNRIEPGVIVHLGHGRIVMGEYQRWPEPRTHDIATLIRHAGVPCTVTDNLEAAHREKLVWNIPFNGLGVASSAGYDAVLRGDLSPDHVPRECLSTDRLLSDPKWEQLVRELMRETIRAAQALGFKVSNSIEDLQVKRTREMGAYLASTLIDFQRGQALELESLFLEPLRQAQKSGIPTPRLAALCRVLGQLNRA